jgi:hypothetical protein
VPDFYHLVKLKAANWAGDNFSLCDDITSGFMQGWCADLQERFDHEERKRKLETITAKWTLAEKAAFQSLELAAKVFFVASSRNEVDLTGTGRAAFEIEAQADLENGFVAALERLERASSQRLHWQNFREPMTNSMRFI